MNSEMYKSHLLNPNQLDTYSNFDERQLPDGCGQKDLIHDASSPQSQRLQSYYQELSEILREERIELQGKIVKGEWNPSKKLVEFEHELGKFWTQMGFGEQGRKWLYPEEALYTMESNILETYSNGLPLSIEEAYYFFLEPTSMEEYHVFAHLRRLGYILRKYTQSIDHDSSMNHKTIQDTDLSHNLHVFSCEPHAQVEKTTLPIVECAEECNATNILPSTWDFTQIALPNMAGTDVLTLSTPDVTLLPAETTLAKSTYQIDVAKINADSQTKRRKRRDDTEFPGKDYSDTRIEDCKKSAANWSEYKTLVKTVLEASVITLQESSAPQPLLTPADTFCKVKEKIDIVRPVDYSLTKRNTKLKLSYNVYLPKKGFKKSDPGKPCYRLAVVRLHDHPVTLLDLYSLQTSDVVPLLLAVVGDTGQPSFMTINPIDLVSV